MREQRIVDDDTGKVVGMAGNMIGALKDSLVARGFLRLRKDSSAHGAGPVPRKKRAARRKP